MCKLLYEGVERYIVGVHTLLVEGTMVFLRFTLYIGEMDTPAGCVTVDKYSLSSSSSSAFQEFFYIHAL